MVITEDTKKVCEILGIDPDTSDDEVDKAYSAMMAQWHTSSDNLTKEKLVELILLRHIILHRCEGCAMQASWEKKSYFSG